MRFYSTRTAFLLFVVVVVAVLAVAPGRTVLRFWAYEDELEHQLTTIDGVARKVPHVGFHEDVLSALSLQNVWGNVIQSEFFPSDDGDNRLERMRELTKKVASIAEESNAENAVSKLLSVYGLLLDIATDKDFVARYRQADLALLVQVEQREPARK